ncbi:carbonic anhydrase [Boletus edulis]|uniref:Carbonic anhydrase n=1 Tax=Boletus edulis BED1 TaxID=1328754 RepID=A0AAD4BRH4_BOLED|nr:carbonic anhydrase [Boletus edulis]KAF8438389.1 carbonic anhydrase [Boletus edulis BED1]
MIPPTSPVHALLDGNAKWADAVDRADPGFFQHSAKGQSPKILWFGCSDSRVPESVITGARPGDIFVHRNVANQCHPDDDSALAVLSYAVGTVGVEHVIVAGHTCCGGAAACYEAVAARSATATKSEIKTPLTRWLTPLMELIASLDLASAPAGGALDLIVHENVKRQVEHVCATEAIQQAWAAGKQVSVHGWVYDVASGRIRDVGVSRGPFGVSVQL